MSKNSKLKVISKTTKSSDKAFPIIIFPEYCEILERLTVFSHLIILSWLNVSDKKENRNILKVTPERHHIAIEKVFTSRNIVRLSLIRFLKFELYKKDEIITPRDLAELRSSIVNVDSNISKVDTILNTTP